MSMTRKEAIDIIENKIQIDVRLCTDEEIDQYQDALYMAIAALRTPTREQVEKIRGEWIIQQDEHREYQKKCSKCGFPISGWWGADKFCANCGAPMTDEAVDMMMERWKEAVDGEQTD